jgi:tRNA threonylcarbamoyladenosine biosynthesis protein TsaB
VSPSDLSGIAVGVGPGSYTGLRIGVTAAKTLAYAIGVPLVGLDSLEIVARGAPDDALFVSAIGDAQRGDLYVADFHRPTPRAPLERLAPTRVVAVDEWADSLPEEAFLIGPALAVGRLAAAIPARFRRPDNPQENWPHPRGLLDLARETWATGRRDDPFSLEPTYLRRSAAEDQWEKLGK